MMLDMDVTTYVLNNGDLHYCPRCGDEYTQTHLACGLVSYEEYRRLWAALQS